MAGVFDLELMRMYGYLYQKGNVNYTILHSFSGHDEISLTTDCKFVSNKKEGIISPNDFKVKSVNDEDIFGGNTLESSVEIFKSILLGNGTEAQNNVVCANAAVAISMVKNCSLKEGFDVAKENLINGNAKKSLDRLIQLNRN